MKYLRAIGGTAFVRGVGILASGTLMAQAVPIVITPLLTRIYNPEEMGQLGLFTAFLGVAVPLGSLQYSKAIVSAKSDKDALLLFWISMAIIPVTTLLLGAALFVLITCRMVGYGTLSVWVVVPCLLSLLANGVFTTYRFWALRFGKFGVISRATVWQSMLRSLAQVGLGLVHFGSLGLMFAESIGRGAGSRRLASGTEAKNFGVLTKSRWSDVRYVAHEFRRFPLISAPSILINSIALAAPIPLISLWYGTDYSGQFSVAYRIMVIPMGLVGAAIGDVFHNQLAEVARTSPASAKPLFLRVSGLLFMGAVMFSLVILIIPEDVWTGILGDQWQLAARLMGALLPWIAMQLMVAPLSQVIPVYQRHDLKFFYDIVGLISVTIVLWYGSSSDWELLDTMVFLGFTQALAYLLYYFLLYKAIPDSGS